MNEVMHFTNNPETKEIAEVKVSKNDNAYGFTWANLVREYLKTSYAGEETQCEVESFGKTYKILKRDKVTVFYDESGNTLFDVVNERLQKEYEWIMKDDADLEADEIGGELPDAQTEPESAMGKTIASIERQAFEAAVTESEEIADAEAKLKGELDKAKEKNFAKPVIEYLIERCKESGSLAADICQEHKTWGKCYSYIVDQAKKKLSGKSGPVRDDVVFEWAEDYYHLDDKALEEKRAKEAAERKKKEAERKKRTAEKKPVAETKGSSDKAAVQTVVNADPPKKKKESPKTKRNELEGQMDMFALMGM